MRTRLNPGGTRHNGIGVREMSDRAEYMREYKDQNKEAAEINSFLYWESMSPAQRLTALRASVGITEKDNNT